MRNQPLDLANKTTQIIIKDSCAGISLYPKADDNLPIFESFVDNAFVRVELVRKSQPNAVLYYMKLSDLFEIWKGFFKTPKGVVIPFALKDNLLLNKDSYLQVDIRWTGVVNVSDLKIQNNTVATSTNVPISFKKIEIDEELEVNTEHFEYAFIPDTIHKIETFTDGYLNELTNKTTPQATKASASLGNVDFLGRTEAQRIANDSNLSVNKPKVDTGNCCCSHEVKRQKIEMDFNYMSFMTSMPTDNNVLFKTEANQKIKFFGIGEVTLMQA